jgi:NAD(P)-dependent dehydrogenase (short-subunit alcohol dehydrogenase family)
LSRLDGRIALVTGGGSGIGRAVALAMVDAGAAAVVVADVDAEGARETAALVEAKGAQARALTVDVTDADAVESAVATTLVTFGGLDVASNNAGVNYDIDDWRRTLDINLTGTFLCLRAELRAMSPASGGRGGAIVNMSSGAGLMGFPGLPAYVASKHGILGLTKAAALEYVREGIRVNAVCPGSTRTPLLEGFMAQDPGIEKMITRGSPMGRLATPEEIAAAVVWLCSDDASFVVGHALVADAGATIQ